MSRFPFRLPALVLMLWASGLLHAEDPAFAWQWPIEGGDGVLQLQLDPSVYNHIQRDDLGDLVALDAAGRRLPMGPLDQIWTPPVRHALPMSDVPYFVLPSSSSSAGSGDSVELHLRRSDDGRLTALDASVRPDATAEIAGDLLLDLSALDAPINAVQLALDVPDDAEFHAQVRIEGSNDLASWNALGAVQTLVKLDQGGFVLLRDRLTLPTTRLPYLRLRRVDNDDGIPLTAVSVQTLPSVQVELPAQDSVRVEGEAVPNEPGVFVYRSPGPFPAEHLALEPSSSGQISAVVVSSRGDAQQAWRERARFTLFNVEIDGTEVDSERMALTNYRAALRDREWRVVTRPALDAPPTLRLDYTPDRFVLLTRGDAPYRLAAGSATAVRETYPLPELLAEIRRSRSDDWRPPMASLGSGSALQGDSALQTPPTPLPLRQILLWSILVGAALLLLFLVARLLREPPQSDR